VFLDDIDLVSVVRVGVFATTAAISLGVPAGIAVARAVVRAGVLSWVVVVPFRFHAEESTKTFREGDMDLILMRVRGVMATIVVDDVCSTTVTMMTMAVRWGVIDNYDLAAATTVAARMVAAAVMRT